MRPAAKPWPAARAEVVSLERFERSTCGLSNTPLPESNRRSPEAAHTRREEESAALPLSYRPTKWMAEEVGFEPTRLIAYTLSRGAPSAARPPFREMNMVSGARIELATGTGKGRPPNTSIGTRPQIWCRQRESDPHSPKAADLQSAGLTTLPNTGMNGLRNVTRRRPLRPASLVGNGGLEPPCSEET